MLNRSFYININEILIILILKLIITIINYKNNIALGQNIALIISTYTSNDYFIFLIS